MFILKKKYFLIIQNIKDINLNNIKPNNKFFIILRNKNIGSNIDSLIRFRKKCKIKGFKFFVANNLNLGRQLKSDGFYISSHNKGFKHLHQIKKDSLIIGSAHNFKEINQKRIQGCKYIICSKLFKVDYNPKDKFYGVLKFNNLLLNNNKVIPLGGIKLANLNKLKIVRSKGLAIMSEIKKKPAISSRLF